VDNAARELHGGLIDAQLLADVYLAMTSGQVVLEFGFETGAAEQGHAAAASILVTPLRRPRILRADAVESAAHEAWLDALDKAPGGSQWRREPVPESAVS